MIKKIIIKKQQKIFRQLFFRTYLKAFIKASIRYGWSSAKRMINPFEDCFVKFGNEYSEETLVITVVLKWDQKAFNRWNS